VSLGRVLGDSVNWVTPLAQGREIDIEFDAAQFASMNVVADSIRLKQVFLNLLSNSVKYNRQGGRVEVLCDTLDSVSLRVGIRDSGAGISPEKLKELFQPFNRLGAEFSGIEGSGIGLVISRQLLDLMDGELSIESEVGVGSTFWVRLKLAPALASVSAAGSENSAFEGRVEDANLNPRILVAEDNLINQELMAAQLDMLGYEADYAENGVQALAHWRQGNYALLLTDMRMPEMNGYDLVREIRQLEHAGGVELEDLRSALQKWVPVESQNSSPQHAPVPVEFVLPGGASTIGAIDFDVLAQSTGDKPELHRSLLQSYGEALKDELGSIQQAFAGKNSEQIADYSHKLKSSSSSLGVTALAQVCEQLESGAKQQIWPDLEQLMPHLRKHGEAALRSIQAYLQRDQESSQLAVDEDDPDLTLPDDEAEEVTQFSIRLLLLDDDYIMHRITSVMLNDLGVSQVINAMSGPAALDILKAQSDAIDVIICDLNMPEMDGVEFIRHLARRDYSGSLILTSGEDLRILKTVEKLAIEHSLQVLGILEKPVTPVKLRELLDSLDQIQQEGTLMVFDAITLPELKDAIYNDELETYFQPKIDIATGRVVGVEALARWNHPVNGLIRPNSFISMAEDNGLISALTDTVCRKAMEYAARLKAMDCELNIAINLSVDSLKDLDWPEKITEVLRGYGLEASSISFEITESRLMEDLSILNSENGIRCNCSIEE